MTTTTALTTPSADTILNRSQKTDAKAQQSEIYAKRALSASCRADVQAERAETLARRAEFDRKNYNYTYETKSRLAGESYSYAKTETDAWDKFSQTEAIANVSFLSTCVT